MSIALFRITNGVDYVDLISGPVYIREDGWTPSYVGYKSNGVRRNPPMADGERLISANYANVIETISLTIAGSSPDQAIATLHKLENLFAQAKDYWTARSRADIGPVWIEKRAHGETNTAYSIVILGNFTGLGNWFDAPFLQADCSAVQDNVILQLEHGLWLSNPPGEADCVPVKNSQRWSYNEWAVCTSAPVLDVNVLFEDSAGVLYAGESTSGGLLRSTDGGTTWVSPTVDPTGMEMAMCEDDLGRVYVYTNVGVYRSTDHGDHWTQISVAIQTQTRNSICFSPINKAMYAINTSGNAYYSADYGVNWTLFSNLGATLGATGYSIFVVDTGSKKTGVLLIGHNGSHGGSSHIQHWYVYAGTAVPTSVQTVYDGADSTVLSFYQPGDGYVYAGVTGEIYRAAVADMMLDWAQCASGFNGGIYAFTYDGQYYYTTGNARIYFSTNMLYWKYRSASGATQFYSMVYSSVSDRTFAGEAGDIWWVVPTAEVGQMEPTCDGAYAVNHHSQSNLTHAYVYDAAPAPTYTRVFPASSLPVELLPHTPAVGDMLYLGFDTSHPAVYGHLNIVFDIETPCLGVTGVWEYSTNVGWSAVEGYVDHTSTFGVTGVNPISFCPSTVAPRDVNGVTGYWFRFRVTAVGAVLSAPTQANRNIYAVTWPFVEIEAEDVGGNVPAALAIEVIDQGDKSGPENNAVPERWSNFVAVGLRSLSRGENFSAYLPCAYDNQVVPGVTVQVGPSCTLVDQGNVTYLTSPARYCVNYSPATSQAMAPRVTFTIPAGLAQEWYGVYHAFVRCYEQYSATYGNEISIRVKAATGGAGLQTCTKTVQLPCTGRGTGAAASSHLVSLGRLNMPASGVVKVTEIGQDLTIAIEASSDGGHNYMIFYDLILLPADEWLGFFFDDVANLDTPIQYGQKLLIDSVLNPKLPLRAVGQSSSAGEFIKSIWSPDANGPAMLQANTDQRLWFLTGLRGVVSVADNSGTNNKSYFYNSGGYLVEYGIKIGQEIYNLTDGSHGIITAVTPTTINTDLHGGADNDFDNGDVMLVFTDYMTSCFEALYKIKLWYARRYLSARGSS